MTSDPIPSSGWNVFARVLQDLLAVRGLGLGHLDDRAKIHPQKVWRLRLSLKVPKSFPVLNIEEIEQVFTVFGFRRQERIRLRAAILATAIEETLMDRINQQDALRAAEQILPIIEAALYTYAEDPVGIGAVKKEGPVMAEEVNPELEGALTAIDRATLALHLSLHASAFAERLERARQARDGFELALRLLDMADPSTTTSEIWHVWHDEARHGLDTTTLRLDQLGA